MPTKLLDIIETVKTSHKLTTVVGLYGSSKALLLTRLAQHSPDKAILVITPTQERAQSLLEDCTVFFHTNDARRLRIFPESSCLPYSRLSPEPEIWADRIQALHLLLHSEPLVLIAPVAATMRHTPPKTFISGGARTIRIKEVLDPTELASYLAAYGYEDVGLVEDEGTYAGRGGIFDLWPPTTSAPVRIELDGEKIVSMRFFDPANQRSKNELGEFLIIPVQDFPFDKNARNSAAHRIRGRADGVNLPSHERRTIIEAIHEGIAFAGIETLMPLFHESTTTLFDYLPTDAYIVVDESVDVDSAAAEHFREASELAHDTSSPERMISPEEIILPPSSLLSSLETFRGLKIGAVLEDEKEQQITLTTLGNADLRPLIASHRPNEDMLLPLTKRIHSWQQDGMHIVITCHTELQAARLKDLFSSHGVLLEHFDAPFDTIFNMSLVAIRLRLGRISAGFRWPSEKLIVITDEEIFGAKAIRRVQKSRPMEPFASFSEIAEGDYIVHEHHGIGRYLGLVHLTIEGKGGDYLLLEYLGGDKLYLPAHRLNLVGRYIGSGDTTPMMDRLGGLRWSQVRQKVNASIRTMAKELIDLYAAREVFPGHPFSEGGAPYEEFCAAFPYDETPDQVRAIDEVMRDMSIERPMDRLICGDVGYGKTEVAMRAAFRAAMTGKQIAVLVPTTILAFQHYDTFTRRFRGTPVVIEMLSRFKSPKEQKIIIEEASKGSIDIIIGTHRLLQKDMRFRNLGLLVIDEEHRFGVSHKERIKKLKHTVDVIALTATPIPRTLNLSLSGIRDISVINTPPADRHAIATYIAPLDEGIIRQACLREIARGGQVFFVHNRVETIRSMYDRLSRIIPEARIVIGHGQMNERELEKVMMNFLEKKADILLCTTIIESGLDITNANTIIINRADMMGLAQLYQLRGRVGRSNMHAYAYLLTPQEGEISGIAKKRLTVIKRFTELGSGFQIAMHDLEFRGAGNILGAAQSGHIAAIGYEMYARLLERAMRKLKGKAIEEEIDPELSLRVSAFLPHTYIPDPGTRIDLYRRLANSESADEIESIASELVDRFGPLPSESLNLLGVMEVKVLARTLRMRQITFDGATLSCQLDPTTPLDPGLLLGLVERQVSHFRLVPPNRLLITKLDTTNESAILASAKKSLSRLLDCVSQRLEK